MNDASYPWFVLVPQLDNLSEIFQLSDTDQQQLMRESSFFAKVLSEEFNADKINIAALGNMVKQLHIHHVVRYENDRTWPAPIWGKHPAEPYTPEQQVMIIQHISNKLGDDFTLDSQHE